MRCRDPLVKKIQRNQDPVVFEGIDIAKGKGIGKNKNNVFQRSGGW
jgi:hypothetical protein